MHLTGFDHPGTQSKLPGLKFVCVCVCELVLNLVKFFKTRNSLTCKTPGPCQNDQSPFVLSVVRIRTVRMSQLETSAPEFQHHLTNVYEVARCFSSGP